MQHYTTLDVVVLGNKSGIGVQFALQYLIFFFFEAVVLILAVSFCNLFFFFFKWWFTESDVKMCI